MAYTRVKVRGRHITGVYYYESKVKRIHGRAERCFVITYKRAGKKIWEKIGWESEGYTWQLAQEERAKRVRALRHGKEVRTASEIARDRALHDRPLGEIKEIYFREKEKTLKGFRVDLNRWDRHLKHLDTKRVGDLSPFDIERIKKNMNGLAPATICNALELLRRIISFGAEQRLCPALHFKIKMPQVDNEVIEYLKEDEFDRLKQVLDTWKHQEISRMLRLVIFTGMRKSEVFRLEVEHLDFDKNLIYLVNPKSGRTETIPMGSEAKALLLKQLAWTEKHYPKSPYVFPGRGGGRRTECTAARRIKQAARLPEKFRIWHGLRHHYAVTLASSGEFSLDLISELLTHKDIKTTRRYAKFLPEAMKKVADEAEALLK